LFSVQSTGATTISSLSVTSSDGTKPGILVSKPSDRGDISVPTGQALSLGHWSGSAFSEKLRIPSSGGISIYNSAGSSVVASISNTGRATIDIQDGINFYDGTTNRGRLRASTAATRLVFDQPLNVDGLLTVSTGGINITGAAVFSSTISGATRVSSSELSATSGIISADGPSIPTTTSTVVNIRWSALNSPRTDLRQLQINTSSQRYKEEIVEADSAVIEAAKNIKAFHFKSKLEADNGETFLGFIAEQVMESGLSHGVVLNEAGQAENIALTSLLAGAYAWIRDLEGRVAELEG
jgi:hypothetical protein